MTNLRTIIMTASLCWLSSWGICQSQQANYFNSWQKVHYYELQNLPKSAASLVDTIFLRAKNEGNSVQSIKALIYQSKFISLLQEEAQLKIINNLKREIGETRPPTSNVLESILAHCYWQYFQQNRWRIYNRTRTNKQTAHKDFRTWDIDKLFSAMHQHFQRSLLNADTLQMIPLSRYDDLLKLEEGSKKIRPTLYDFLVHNALDFYKTDESSITKPSYKFELDHEKYFGDLAAINLYAKDSASLQFQALKLYKSLSSFHTKEANADAKVAIEMERLKFVRAKSILYHKDSLYLTALQKLRNQYDNLEISSKIDFEIASYYYEMGQLYDPNGDTSKRFDKVKAFELCSRIVEDFPAYQAAKNAKILKLNILQKSLNLTVEKYIPNLHNARILVDYSNIDSLHFNIFPLSITQVRQINQSRHQDFPDVLKGLASMNSWQSNLRDGADYQRHKTEVLLPGHANGHYLILASTHQNFLEGIYAYDVVQFTDLLLLSNGNHQTDQYQLVNRITGEPLTGASVRFSNQHMQRVRNIVDKMLVTDKNGMVSYTSNRNAGRVDAEIIHNEEKAYFSNFYLYKSYRSKGSNESITAKAFLFTDRSIYRPGQTVYFKGILVSRKGDQSKVVPNEYVAIRLQDVNGEVVGSMELLTNEYGSFSGEFILPAGGITGRYNLYVKEGSKESVYYDRKMDSFEYNSKSISVEEYKRPRFDVDFDPIKGVFRLNDTILVHGNAVAFAGSSISNAKVIYKVERNVQYPRWNSWRRWQPSAPQEITHGETITDADGKFVIAFKALPDITVSPKSQPIFTYTVSADITDIDGETRTATGTVKVGYHAMIASVATSRVDKAAKDNAFQINTSNLNGEFTSASGSIKIYQLNAPSIPLRKRPWSAPDFEGFSEAKFRELFPNDPFQNEHVEENWNKGTLVYESNFDTQKSYKLPLGNMKKWKTGKYLLELVSTDIFGQQVRDVSRFEVYHSKENTSTPNALLSISADKETYRVGEKALIKLASTSQELYVMVTILKDGNEQLKIIQLQNGSAEFEVPINTSDQGGFSIAYHFVRFNSFQSGTLNISVPYERSKLTIERETFRDKIIPGAEQTWSFNIKGKKTDKVAAEILTSMYDASLDEFKPHSWSFQPFKEKNSTVYNSWSARNSLAIHNIYARNINIAGHWFISQKFDQLDWFGFSIAGNKYQHRAYLQDLKKNQLFSSVKSSSISELTEGQITGQVVDIEGNPLPGATILVVGKDAKAISDMKGNFSLQAKKSDRLRISYIGYKSVYVEVIDHNNFNVVLAEDLNSLDEVVVAGAMPQKRSSFTGSVADVEVSEETVLDAIVFEEAPQEENIDEIFLASNEAGIHIRGYGAIDYNNPPLFVVDGVITPSYDVSSAKIASIEVLKGAPATAVYGSKAKNGVLIITTKAGKRRMEAELGTVKARSNLQETAFFFPHLQTDEKGNVNFSFTAPEALTRWKFQMLAHDKKLASALITSETVTQKDLMITPNAPRFLREGDQLVFTSKISNLTDQPITGIAALQLFDAVIGEPIDESLENYQRNQNFIVSPRGNTTTSWSLTIPSGLQAVQYKVVAKAGDFSDGEQNILPVLSNRMLVTETLPMWVNSNESKTFHLDKLEKNSSKTLKNHKLTLEVTSNPAWYALQALPYLMEYPYECAEQTFSRYYANALGSHVVNTNPRIKEVFDQWADSGDLVSNLEKNQELKSILIQETPWLRDAQSESEQKKRIALLFDLNQMKDALSTSFKKLQEMQLANGGFPWFKGSNRPNRYITQHIVSGFGHLMHLGVKQETFGDMVNKTIRYLDNEIIKDYEKLHQTLKKSKKTHETEKEFRERVKEFWKARHLSSIHIHYLYMRSFFKYAVSDELRPAYDFYSEQIKNYWKDQNNYLQGMIALSLYRAGDTQTPEAILRSLEEYSVRSEELGMYWKAYDTNGWNWSQSSIETQALLIEAYAEIKTGFFAEKEQQKIVDELKIWLLKNKQTNRWKSTKATTEAVYALLLQGSDWLSVAEMVDVKIGNYDISPAMREDTKVEAGTGYFKTSWVGSDIQSEMSRVTIAKKNDGIAWGGLYWQYFETLENITTAESPLKINKQLYLKYTTDKGEEMKLITDSTAFNLGDLVRVRIEISVDREMEFAHMKDMRASGFEPLNVMSKYKWQDGLGYYESTKDASTNFFFEKLKKGVYVFEYDLRANNEGSFSNGITTIQSMYAPEFSSHSEGARIKIVELEK